MTRIDLASHLLNYIIENALKPGDVLPPIKDLATQHLGISTSKVREELEVARVMGWVDVRSKTGTRLKAFEFTPCARLGLFYALAHDVHHFEAFSEVRTHLEIAFWHEACQLITDEDIATMQQCITEARIKLHSSPILIPAQEHRVFHLTVFKRLQNPFVLGLLEAYWDAYDTIAMTRYVGYDYLKKVWEYHEMILQHIIAKDFETAKQVFTDHTRLLQPFLSQSLPGASDDDDASRQPNTR